jgi:hypothetical protein
MTPTRSAIEFHRAPWQIAFALFFGRMFGLLLLLALMQPFALPIALGLLYVADKGRLRVRVALTSDGIAVTGLPGGGARRIARADLIEIRHTPRTLSVVLATGEALPLVTGRRIRAADLRRARILAGALRVLLVDAGALPEVRAALPAARVTKELRP